jgi:hypothetical protein
VFQTQKANAERGQSHGYRHHDEASHPALPSRHAHAGMIHAPPLAGRVMARGIYRGIDIAMKMDRIAANKSFRLPARKKTLTEGADHSPSSVSSSPTQS